MHRKKGYVADEIARAQLPVPLVKPVLAFLLVTVPGLLILLLGARVGLVVTALALLACLGPLLAMAGMNGDDEEDLGEASSWASSRTSRED